MGVALFNQEITIDDVTSAMLESVWDGLTGDIRFIIENYDWFDPSRELTDEEITTLAKHTVGAWEEFSVLAVPIGALTQEARRIAGAKSATKAAGYPTTRAALHQYLLKKGYTAGELSPNGYQVYKHADGSRITIKPSGEVIPTKRVPIDPNNPSWNAPKYNQRVYYDGTPIPDGAHTTGHYVKPYKP